MLECKSVAHMKVTSIQHYSAHVHTHTGTLLCAYSQAYSNVHSHVVIKLSCSRKKMSHNEKLPMEATHAFPDHPDPK